MRVGWNYMVEDSIQEVSMKPDVMQEKAMRIFGEGLR